MVNSTTTRRRFLVAAIALSGIAGGVSILKPVRVWAQATGRPAGAMVRAARMMFPHDGVDDAVYAEILDDALMATANNDSFAEILDAAGLALGPEFSTLGEDAQLAALESRQGDSFFTSIFTEVRARLYDHPACWQVLGYGGPSFEDGGYLHRGAGEIDWLPESE